LAKRWLRSPRQAVQTAGQVERLSFRRWFCPQRLVQPACTLQALSGSALAIVHARGWRDGNIHAVSSLPSPRCASGLLAMLSGVMSLHVKPYQRHRSKPLSLLLSEPDCAFAFHVLVDA
jgi:hypothetical protein